MAPALLALSLAPAAAAGPALPLGPPRDLAAGRYEIRPLAGLVRQGPGGPGVEGFFLGDLPGRGSVSLLVMFLPEPANLPTTPAALSTYAAEVAEGLDAAQVIGARLLPAGGIELEFSLTQIVAGQPERMYMVQRQADGQGGMFSLTAACLRAVSDELAPAMKRSLDTFGPAGRAAPGGGAAAAVASDVLRRAAATAGGPALPASAEARLEAASKAMAAGRFAEADFYAAAVPRTAEFARRVAAFRIRMAALLGQGKRAEVRGLAAPFRRLWQGDDRPFSAHYADLLGRGEKTFFARLDEIQAGAMGDGERAALAQVALTAWAGPAAMIPPRITRRQDVFFEALKGIAAANAAAWVALTPALDTAAREVEGFLESTAAAGRTLSPREADYQWLESSLFLPLAAALHQRDLGRYQKVLRLFEKVGPRPGPLGEVSTATLASLGPTLAKGGESFPELAYRLWAIPGDEVYARTRALLKEEGLAGLVQRSVDALEGAR